MKTLLLLRHAKSDWGDNSLADFDRPLNSRGLKDAPCMGQILAKLDLIPDLVLASPAKRAKQTAELVAKNAAYAQDIQWNRDFYGGGSRHILAALQALPDKFNRVLVIGHNPTMEETISSLVVGEEEILNIRMATAALVCLDLSVTHWSEINLFTGTLRWLLTPKLIKKLV